MVIKISSRSWKVSYLPDLNTLFLYLAFLHCNIPSAFGRLSQSSTKQHIACMGFPPALAYVAISNLRPSDSTTQDICHFPSTFFPLTVKPTISFSWVQKKQFSLGKCFKKKCAWLSRNSGPSCADILDSKQQRKWSELQFFTSLPLKKARSSLGAPVVSRATRPLV